MGERLRISQQFSAQVEIILGLSTIDKSIFVGDELLCLDCYGSTVYNEIRLSPRLLGDCSDLLVEVLLHEFVHLVQKGRRGIAYSEISWLEREAFVLARSAEHGRWPVERDRDDEVRYWGPAGHYYLPYYVMQAAGLDQKAAFKRAFYSQMPDQVFEFDAIGCHYNRSVLRLQPRRASDRPFEFEGSGFRRLRSQDSLPSPYIGQRRGDLIKAGLHCLTGGAARSEESARQRILLRHLDNDFLFGLALHPFGDSRAHHIGPMMFGNVLGHLKESFEAALGVGVDPDSVTGRSRLALRYGLELYNIVSSCITPAISNCEIAAILTYALSSVPYESLETINTGRSLISRMNSAAQKIGLPYFEVLDNPYVARIDGKETLKAPEYWDDEFYLHHIEFLSPKLLARTKDALFEEIVVTAGMWANEAAFGLGYKPLSSDGQLF